MAKILIVDDEVEITELLKTVLEKDRHVVDYCHTGAEAMIHLATESPDMVLVDVSMPEMDGYTFISLLHENESTREIPAIVLTGRDRLRDVFLPFSNVVDFIPKPFDVVDLRARVQAGLKKRETV